MESFEEKLNKYTDRNELISHLKYLKDIGVISSVKTKGKETFELVMTFLESVEMIEKDSEVERKIVFENQSLVIMYNTLAAKVEKNDIQKMTENFKVNVEKTKTVPDDVQVVAAYGSGKLVEKEKIKKKKIKLEEFTENISKNRDMFGFKLKSENHKIVKLILEKKCKGDIKKILGIDNSIIRECLKMIDKTKFEVIEKGLKNEKTYRIIKI